jgi:RHS repeat-associated protein
MSNKASTAPQPISLPKGGGAVAGIGETFTPDLHTGTGNASVPIALPPGRNGFQPTLTLAYSSGNGNGPFGLGWSPSVPGITRKTSHGVPRYDDRRDTFVLSGAEDLVEVPGGPAGARRYRPRTEGLFARIDHHRSPATDHWEVRSRDGLVSVYGTPGAAGSDPAVVADPDDRGRVFAWRLSRTTDPFGNRIEYRYERDATQTAGPHRWDQLYLSEIRYADHGDPANPQFLVTVRFVYEQRPDPYSDYRAGFEVRTVKRCVRTEVATHAEQDLPARTYHLVYQDQRGLPADQLPANGVSLLSQVRVEGHDGDRSELLPPLEFGYTRFQPQGRRFTPVGGAELPPLSLASPDVELADLFGQGLPDLLQMNGTVRYWRNLGDGRYDLPRELPDAPAGVRLGDSGVQLVDADGDGRAELLVTTAPLAGYYPTRFGAAWDRQSFHPYQVAPSFSLEDPEVRLVDLDGDGVIDAVRSATRLECFFNDPHLGWVETRQVDNPMGVSFSDPRVRWADMSGDGLQDLVLVHDGLVSYRPSRGRGDFGAPVAMANSPRLPDGYNPRRILVGDVDGDGLADFLYVDDGTVTLWINQGGTGWSQPITVTGTPAVSDMDAVRLADLHGTGVAGVLWSFGAAEVVAPGMFFLDFTGGEKPYLLSEIDNHRGAVTRIGYAPSTRFYLQDQRRPKTRWTSPLPFPVQVVARVETVDQLSGGKLTTQYAYHHGYWDGAEREFRGFGRVDQRDSEAFDDYHTAGLHPPERAFQDVPATGFSPPTETRTWFHQGPVGDEFGGWTEQDLSAEYWNGNPPAIFRPAAQTAFLDGLPRRARRDALRALRGRVLRSELYALDGTTRQDRPHTVTEQVHGLREEAPPGPGEPADRRRIFFPHTLAERVTQWERGSDPMTRCTFTGDYDPYGQPRAQSSIAVPRGRDFRSPLGPGQPADPYLATQTLTSYAQRDDADAYLVDRVAATTTYELPNDGRPALAELQATVEATPGSGRIIAQTLRFYDGPAFDGLPFGQLGRYGALTRTEVLTLTDSLLHEAYRSGDSVLDPPETPPYLAAGDTPAWTPEYPQEFRSLLALAGHTRQSGGTVPAPPDGYFAAAERRCYDFQQAADQTGRGLVTGLRDPLGHDTTVGRDRFDLLPADVSDPVGLTTHADYDYRVLQPSKVTDPNGNRIAFTFSPLGLLQTMAVMGKADEQLGDTPAVPGTRWLYDFLALDDPARRQPVSVRTVRRVHHATDTGIPLPERDQTIEMVEFSDGFGRLLQTRTQAEDVAFGDPAFGDAGLPADQTQNADAVGQHLGSPQQPRVAVSGWQVYDNKGRVVEKYEPFFALGWAYRSPDQERTESGHEVLGQKATLFYDPLGRLIRTVNPDGSQQRTLHGVPGTITQPDLSNPDRFEPTPWERYTYDGNDNAGRTHPASSTGYQSHWNTPSSALVDALGRTVQTIQRNGTNPTSDWYVTRASYDLRGNLLTVTDALGRVASRHVYDLAATPHLLRTESIDAGVERMVLDAAGNVLEQRDSKGALRLHGYDAANRPSRLWARDDPASPVTLRERLDYGDGGDPHQPAGERAASQAANLLGKLARHYDEAGLLVFDGYDFKGNLLAKSRQVIADAAILSVFDPPPPGWQVPAFRVDWQPPPGTSLQALAAGLLDPTRYWTSLRYDALDRPTSITLPQDVDGDRKSLQLRYNPAGALERVDLDATTYVDRIAYNAKGQRTLVALGNGVMTRHAYDPVTFRLARLRSEPYTKPGPTTYHPSGAAFQDFGYGYDLAGNLLSLHDRTPGGGLPIQPDQLDRTFTYYPIYWLRSATGRECDTLPPSTPWDDMPKCTDLTRTRAYAQTYTYDPVGNLLSLVHSVGAGGSFTRGFTLDPDNLAPRSNRLSTLDVGAFTSHYAYDASGNLTVETTSRHFEWDHSDRLRVYRTQPDGAEPSVHAHFLYDPTGQRVKKLVRKQGGQVEVTVYIDGGFEHHRRVQPATTAENNTIHVMDNQQRIALLRVGTPFPDDTSPATTYHLGDHLGSSTTVLDAAGGFVNREEYTPYGQTSFGSYAKKRYRFTGKERDEESGLAYHGARYYAPWLCRWTSSDPAALQDSTYVYAYAANSPLRLVDANGASPAEAASALPSSQAATQQAQRVAKPGLKLLQGGRSATQATRLGPLVAVTIVAVASWGWAIYQWHKVYEIYKEVKQERAEIAAEQEHLAKWMPRNRDAPRMERGDEPERRAFRDYVKAVLERGCPELGLETHPLKHLLERIQWDAGHAEAPFVFGGMGLAVEARSDNRNSAETRAGLNIPKPAINICGIPINLDLAKRAASDPKNQLDPWLTIDQPPTEGWRPGEEEGLLGPGEWTLKSHDPQDIMNTIIDNPNLLEGK